MDHPWLKHYDPGVPAHPDSPRIPLYRLLDDSAAANPSAPCAAFFGKTQSYGRMKALSDNLAASLMGLGVGPGDRVGLLMPNSPQFIVSYYAVLKTGATVVSLNPLANPKELALLVQDSGMETLIAIPLFLESVAALQKIRFYPFDPSNLCSIFSPPVPRPQSLIEVDSAGEKSGFCENRPFRRGGGSEG